MKIKLILVISLFIVFATTYAQDRVSTKTGTLKFEASTPNFEPVAATNSATSAILKNDGAITVLALIKGFQFNKALMQKHFNSKKWVNSQEFPKAVFKGQIKDLKLSDLSAEAKEYKVVGVLTFHGVTKEISSMATLVNKEGVVYLNTKFDVKVADYNIIVKSKLAKKIAETVSVVVNLELK